MAGVGTGMSVDTPGTSRVIIGDKLQGPNFQPSTSPDWGICTLLWSVLCRTPIRLLRPLGSLKPQAQSG